MPVYASLKNGYPCKGYESCPSIIIISQENDCMVNLLYSASLGSHNFIVDVHGEITNILYFSVKSLSLVAGMFKYFIC